MLVQRQPGVYEKGNIIFHRHIDGVFQRVDLKQPRISVIASAYGIVQLQQLLLILKDHDKQM